MAAKSRLEVSTGTKGQANLLSFSDEVIHTSDSAFQGIEEYAEDQVCAATFCQVSYPDEVEFVSKGKEKQEEEFGGMYRLVYCVDCCLPVSRAALSDRTKIEKVTIKEQEYLVFKCKRCQDKAQQQVCIECGQ